jgi:hypothetical protein
VRRATSTISFSSGGVSLHNVLVALGVRVLAPGAEGAGADFDALLVQAFACFD